MNLRKLHKWIAALVGIQVLLWVSGGVYMSAMPLEWVHGRHLLNPEKSIVTPANDVLAKVNLSLYQSLRWVDRAGYPVLEAINLNSEVEFLDPANANLTPLTKLSESVVSKLAVSRYAGRGKVVETHYIETPPHEASGITIPIYKVAFDDWCNTTFYLHPYTGNVLKVRSDIWRLFDIFWMLHIMDYENRDNINNPLLIASAIVALFFSVTGMLLIFTWLQRLVKRRRALA